MSVVEHAASHSLDVRYKVLGALAPSARAELAKALGNEFEVVHEHTVADAMQRLESETVDIIICGIYFDDHRRENRERLGKCCRSTQPYAGVLCFPVVSPCGSVLCGP